MRLTGVTIGAGHSHRGKLCGREHRSVLTWLLSTSWLLSAWKQAGVCIGQVCIRQGAEHRSVVTWLFATTGVRPAKPERRLGGLAPEMAANWGALPHSWGKQFDTFRPPSYHRKKRKKPHGSPHLTFRAHPYDPAPAPPRRPMAKPAARGKTLALWNDKVALPMRPREADTFSSQVAITRNSVEHPPVVPSSPMGGNAAEQISERIVNP